MIRTLFLVFYLIMSAPAQAKLKVVTTTTDLAALVREIGKDKVEVRSIAKGTQDAHQIEAKPSYMIMMRDADLVLAQGLELESAWLVPLIQGARNSKIGLRSTGYMEIAGQVNPIEVRTGPISRAEGDVHPGGNPHFQLDPIRLGLAAKVIATKLAELDSANGEFYKKNGVEWNRKIENQTKNWLSRIKKSGVSEVVTYHKTLSYFCTRFEVRCDLHLEPRPGIPPTASHLLEVITAIKKRHIPIVLIENLYDLESAEKLKGEVPGLKVVEVPVSVLGEEKIVTNEQLIERLVREIEKAGKN